MIAVFLNPNKRYLLDNTFLKFSKVMLLREGSYSGEVTAISAFVFRDAKSVRRIGASTITTMHRQIICFTVCDKTLLAIFISSLLSESIHV